MLKSDWKAKEKEFLDMQKKQGENLSLVEKTLEELDFFLLAIKAKIKTFK